MGEDISIHLFAKHRRDISSYLGSFAVITGELPVD